MTYHHGRKTTSCLWIVLIIIFIIVFFLNSKSIWFWQETEMYRIALNILTRLLCLCFWDESLSKVCFLRFRLLEYSILLIQARPTQMRYSAKSRAQLITRSHYSFESSVFPINMYRRVITKTLWSDFAQKNRQPYQLEFRNQ